MGDLQKIVAAFEQELKDSGGAERFRQSLTNLYFEYTNLSLLNENGAGEHEQKLLFDLKIMIDVLSGNSFVRG
jgi:hypothetical protein